MRKPVHAATLDEVLMNIRDPRRWMDPAALVQLIVDNPSLRGFAYGYAAEFEFTKYLERLGTVISEHYKADDHKKTKADRTFVFGERVYTVQLKSVQTNLTKEISPGVYETKVQNDASDSRKIRLPNGHSVQTTCYLVGEYDILGVSIQPFLGHWDFAFKKNKNLKRTTSSKYRKGDRKFLLATLEDFSFPLGPSWTTDLLSLLSDPDLGKSLAKAVAADHRRANRN